MLKTVPFINIKCSIILFLSVITTEFKYETLLIIFFHNVFKSIPKWMSKL